MNFLLLLGVVTMASAMPSYIAVPADQIAFVDLTALRARRVPRQTLSPPAPGLPQALYEDSYQPIPLQHNFGLQNYQQPSVALAPPPPPEAPARLVHAQQQQQHQQQPQQHQQQLQQQQQRDAAGVSTQGSTAQYAERPPDFGEYVDFGAHTGDHGAFGWYADYPVNNQEEHNYRK